MAARLFKIAPQFASSKLILTFSTPLKPVTTSDFSSCNFYILADRRKLILLDATQITLISSSISLSIPKNTKFVEVGILPPPEATFNCNLKLFSITVEQRSDSTDLDDDGVNDDIDNCPASKNSKQLDSNFDGIGDNCTFDRSKYFSSALPKECQDRKNIGPDNDADGISDLCDPDDDNDTISDINELHWRMDVFTAFDFDLEKDTDHDNDGLFSADEIEIGFSPFTPNNPSQIELGPYLLNHNDSLKTTGPSSSFIYQYLSANNYSFSFGDGFPISHYELIDELLLTSTYLKQEDQVEFEHAFEPAIRIFPAPVLVDHEYETSMNITVTYIDHLKDEHKKIPAIAKVTSKALISTEKDHISFSYTLQIFDKVTSNKLLTSVQDHTSWKINEGFIGIGTPDNFTPVNLHIPEVPTTPPIVEPSNDPKLEESSENKKSSSGGNTGFLWLLYIFTIARLRRRNHS